MDEAYNLYECACGTRNGKLVCGHGKKTGVRGGRWVGDVMCGEKGIIMRADADDSK